MKKLKMSASKRPIAKRKKNGISRKRVKTIVKILEGSLVLIIPELLYNMLERV